MYSESAQADANNWVHTHFADPDRPDSLIYLYTTATSTFACLTCHVLYVCKLPIAMHLYPHGADFVPKVQVDDGRCIAVNLIERHRVG